jgi:DNA phosphorothioation-dependent restriction protein DptH
LLFAQDARSVADRVRALLLDDAAVKTPLLERFLREVTGRPPAAGVAALVDRPDLWLGPLWPRVSGDKLRGLKLTEWRDKKGAMLKWSGLLPPEDADGKPRLLLDRDAASKDQARLTVRWTTEPDQLAKGSIEYRVTILADRDELAERTVTHRDRQPQQLVFSLEDFEELEGTEKFQAVVQVASVGSGDVSAVISEEFLLEFGQASGKAIASSGHIERTLVDGAIGIATRAGFDEAIAGGHLGTRISEDRKGFLSWRGEGGRSVRVLRPALIRQVEQDWRDRSGAVGRWIQRVRADGSPAGAAEFVPIAVADGDPATFDKAADASRRFAADLGEFGMLARVQGARWPACEAYVSAWTAALEAGSPQLALHGCVEVRSLSGRPVGLIVTPLHPLRVAWHGLYDQVAAHARYEEGLRPPAVQKMAKGLDSAQVPAVLPGVGEIRGYVFADVLGFHAVAMTLDGELEPKAAVAVLSACLGGGTQAVAASIGSESAGVLARELRHYLDCHEGAHGEQLELLNIQAWRPGDGMTVGRALGEVLSASRAGVDEDEPDASPIGGTKELCFTLDLFHPPAAPRSDEPVARMLNASTASGRFLANVGRRRRAGGGLLETEDRWMTETAPRPGGVSLPRLRWARRPEPNQDDRAGWSEVRAAHVGLIFDVFEARLEIRPLTELGDVRPLHAFGLAKTMERRVDLGETPTWTVFSPPQVAGESAPDGRAATDRLRRLDAAVARATARGLGGGPDDWPVLATRLPTEARARLDLLHQRSDWVVTIDRNAGLEYFDAPHSLPEVYDRFVIDAVPERADLGSLQLITSTANLDAVRDLVDQALGDMGLSSSERNSRFLINQLKGLSGRLAIRLANAAGRTGELIALALVQAHCAQEGSSDGPWLDLTQGFLVPIDEIIDSSPVFAGEAETSDGGRRADFIHVRTDPKRGPLEFRFVEVKHRLHLRTSRQPELLAGMLLQTAQLRRRWTDWHFGLELKPAERALRRSQLARVLHFYADRAARHRLEPKAHARLRAEIDLLVLKEGYQPAPLETPDIGYVFCPEQRTSKPERLYAAGGDDARLWLFGPTALAEDRRAEVDGLLAARPLDEELVTNDRVEVEELAAPVLSDLLATDVEGQESDLPTAPPPSVPETIDVVLGVTVDGGDVAWRLSIRSNPHLMMVGLPGMGKTTSLINICRQLTQASVAPIVFSYHDDIDTKLGDALGEMNVVDFDGLGFNPLRVDDERAIAYVDISGTLRDIFSSVFPDLGDIQLEELRQAIKQSFDDLGWGNARSKAAAPPTPAFRAFFDILQAKAKPNQNLLARLRELADYGFFDGAGERASLLDETRPTIVRVHGTTNGMLQSAFSSFVLYSLYKDMFRRGVQGRLTHAVVFDEAHRAARLKLIPRFAKECRKFGLALALASQGAKDFDPALFEAVGSYLVLRVTEGDARALARNTGATADQQRTADRLKSLSPYTALFFDVGSARPISVRLTEVS